MKTTQTDFNWWHKVISIYLLANWQTWKQWSFPLRVSGTQCVSYTHDSAAGDITDDPSTNTWMPLLSSSATAWDSETKGSRKKRRRSCLIYIPSLMDNKWNHSDMFEIEVFPVLAPSLKPAEGISSRQASVVSTPPFPCCVRDVSPCF